LVPFSFYSTIKISEEVICLNIIGYRSLVNMACGTKFPLFQSYPTAYILTMLITDI